jgi:hypothetical protein
VTGRTKTEVRDKLKKLQAEVIYRHELRPVITTGADVMDQIFI